MDMTMPESTMVGQNSNKTTRLNMALDQLIAYLLGIRDIDDAVRGDDSARGNIDLAQCIETQPDAKSPINM